ncbi:SMP-30/gluconolactonase/LRE family protein [Flavobacterium sp. MMLR14_040]|uniref:SMP-30/gluconolactonase/LRE family protein n=1 Tax=Flavobacterium sp. MMLR14_040 TaxID=3093843 RepID=UPI00298FC4D1|nr:SMP-30/gluconolactonase/LRE family protein [Flavobacterium sp. MMLR14_040]MDW8852124.1 SMP-30/gluconolactonase/LRE family protein [Flavobacterium sp. MMLR14_040]
MNRLQLKIKSHLLFFIAFTFTNFIYAQLSEGNNHNLIAKGAVLTKLSDQYSFTEGPAADKKGNIYFTDQPNNRIMKWSVNGELSVFMENAGRANGLYFDHEGNLLACADEKNEIWKIDQNRNTTVLVNDFEGKRLNGPNDLWVDPKGGVYFTDPFYKRDYWKHTSKEIEKECVYYLSQDKSKIINVDDELIKPNGIIGTSDGKTLFVADIAANKTYSYIINSDGSLGKKTLFTESGSDGMTRDESGNIYLTGKGVTVFNPKGEKIAHIDVQEPWTANVCFGGKKFKTLFITAGKSVYTLEMNIRGMK